MIPGIINELEKFFYSNKLLKIIILLLVFLSLMFISIKLDKNNDTKDDEKAETEEVSNEASEGKELEGFDKKLFDYENEKVKRDLVNDEKIGPKLLLNDMSYNGFVNLILPIIILIICTDIVTQETSSGTLKMLLVSPLGRTNIYLSKLISSIIVVTLTIVTYFILDYLLMGYFYGFRGWSEKILVSFSGNYYELTILKATPIAFLFLFIVMVLYISLALLFSVISDTVISSALLFVVTFISIFMIPFNLSKAEFLKYTPFANMNLYSFLTLESSTQSYDITFSYALISVLLLTVVTIIISLVVVNKRDYFV